MERPMAAGEMEAREARVAIAESQLQEGELQNPRGLENGQSLPFAAVLRGQCRHRDVGEDAAVDELHYIERRAND